MLISGFGAVNGALGKCLSTVFVFVLIEFFIKLGKGDFPVGNTIRVPVVFGKGDQSFFSARETPQDIINGVITFIHTGVDSYFKGLSPVPGQFHNGAVAIRVFKRFASWHDISSSCFWA